MNSVIGAIYDGDDALAMPRPPTNGNVHPTAVMTAATRYAIE